MSWTDWFGAFEDNFSNNRLGTIVELGCGDGTKELFKFADKVVSLEIVTDKANNWLGKVTVPDGSNWQSELFVANDNYNITPEIKEYLDSSIEKYKPDLVFVDCGIHCRGAIVQHLFGKVNYIAAHDTGQHSHEGRDDPYGWKLISIPSEYTAKFYGGQGTSIYIKNNI